MPVDLFFFFFLTFENLTKFIITTYYWDMVISLHIDIDVYKVIIIPLSATIYSCEAVLC